MPELIFTTNSLTRLQQPFIVSPINGQQQLYLQRPETIGANQISKRTISSKNIQGEHINKIQNSNSNQKRKRRTKKNDTFSTPTMSTLLKRNMQNNFTMMTMDITKTEPNTGPTNPQTANNNTMNNTNNNNNNSNNNNNNNNSSSQLCAGCGKHIQDRFLLRALDMLWHEDCLKCGCCDCRLGEVGSTLYTKGNLMLCKRDYLRLFGNTGYCAACNKVIPAFEMVMRARTNVYHLECFACQQCNHRFCVGDRFYLCENKILCEYDYEERLVFASMANHPMLKRHASSIGQGSPTGAAGGLLGGGGGGGNGGGGGVVGGGTMMGPRVPGDHNNNNNNNNNGPHTMNGGSPFGAMQMAGGVGGAGAGSGAVAAAHMKNTLGATS